MREIYGAYSDVSRAMRAYPELIEEHKTLLVQVLRRKAEQGGKDLSTEQDMVFPAPRHYKFDVTEDDEWSVVEVSVEQSSYTRYYVEATYEEITRG